MTEPTPLRMECVSYCLLCRAAGTTLYEGLEDRLFGVSGRFNFSQCPQCGFVWLNPLPIQEDISKCYASYFTHEPPFLANEGGRRLYKWREEMRRLILEACYYWPKSHSERPTRYVLGQLLGAIPPLRRRATYGLDVLFPPWHGEGRLLDVGCGNGTYLAQMRKVGWRVMGVEMDSQAAQIARQYYEVPVFSGTFEEAQFPQACFDAMTMNHVFEHVVDPLALLKECRRVLSPGSYLALVIPNLDSLGHRLFREHWRGLDPPRHLCLWPMATLRRCVEEAGFRVLRCFTRGGLATFIYHTSQQIRKKEKGLDDVPVSPTAHLFRRLEQLILVFRPRLGEEICLLARKERSP